MSGVSATDLRTRFARRLSALYGSEVPAYDTLVDVAHEVNRRVLERDGADAERLGSIGRVTAERHGAIRVGTSAELGQVARVFGALGMHPTGFYDLRDAHPHPIPVISTAFRPLDRDELARNPFRVFTSVLVSADRRFFDADLQQRLDNFLASRKLFPDELLDLADRAEAYGELTEQDAARFLDLAAASFALSPDPVDRAWYTELERISGVEMIDTIQGPPRWHGRDVLLRQTSFRALAEPRRFCEPDGTIRGGELRMRFGEVEARGIALTPRGRDVYDTLVSAVDEQHTSHPDGPRQDLAEKVWIEGFPDTEYEFARQGLAYLTYVVNSDRPADGAAPPHDLAGLVNGGWVTAEPVVYEDFLSFDQVAHDLGIEQGRSTEERAIR